MPVGQSPVTAAPSSLPPPGSESQRNPSQGVVDSDGDVKSEGGDSEDDNDFYHGQGDQTINLKRGHSRGMHFQGKDDHTLASILCLLTQQISGVATTLSGAPDSFDGSNPSKLRNFLQSCQLTFYNNEKTFSKDKKKIKPYFTQLDNEDWMKDHGMASSYILDFKTLTTKISGWSQNGLMYHFRKGLPSSPSDSNYNAPGINEGTTSKPRRNNLANQRLLALTRSPQILQTLNLALTNLIRRSTRGSNQEKRPSLLNKDGTLKSNKRQRQIDQGLCTYCGGKHSLEEFFWLKAKDDPKGSPSNFKAHLCTLNTGAGNSLLFLSFLSDNFISILLDSRATHSFIAKHITFQYSLPLSELLSPVPLHTVSMEKDPSQWITHSTKWDGTIVPRDLALAISSKELERIGESLLPEDTRPFKKKRQIGRSQVGESSSSDHSNWMMIERKEIVRGKLTRKGIGFMSKFENLKRFDQRFEMIIFRDSTQDSVGEILQWKEPRPSKAINRANGIQFPGKTVLLRDKWKLQRVKQRFHKMLVYRLPIVGLKTVEEYIEEAGGTDWMELVWDLEQALSNCDQSVELLIKAWKMRHDGLVWDGLGRSLINFIGHKLLGFKGNLIANGLPDGAMIIEIESFLVDDEAKDCEQKRLLNFEKKKTGQMKELVDGVQDQGAKGKTLGHGYGEPLMCCGIYWEEQST
ncbi:hypothetical protein PPACK8108_LOCUS12921 [Phakopsora pachyrhizi]|uniref:Uncharacterized protein n=1 Tax=Phakopsora pachyrhizi TaxID=170000 RepID=A0AAV0B2P1_PHAPC|nr:hypothetical protein PPACK8108_LOCUS12921 [Phakopsora pachyrhizi]